MYQAADGGDVRVVKLLELGFILDHASGKQVLRRAQGLGFKQPRGPASGGNEDSPARSPAEDSCSCKEPQAEMADLACDDIQHALAVAAFWHGHRCGDLLDADRQWRGYIGSLREQLPRSRAQWDEVQALFSVEPVSHDSASSLHSTPDG